VLPAGPPGDAARGKDVLIAGGISIARQALAAGLADELALHVAPVLLGGGTRLFDALGPAPIGLRQGQARAGDNAVHLRYRVQK